MELAVYFKNGQVAYFQEVKDCINDGVKINFEYFGLTSQKEKQAIFYLENIAGYSITAD